MLGKILFNKICGNQLIEYEEKGWEGKERNAL